MLIQPGCIPCILNMSLTAINHLSLEDTIARDLYSDILTIPGLRGLEWVDRSDLIISKGVGNFDSLGEEINKLKTNITFMQLSKCHPINGFFKTKLHQPILANFFTS
ncbi:hypothetical protein [Desulfobacula sp.]|uniref:hypothetical protein n=1 Tax=Desulfobacula sp. TaxID=2593537 RepID=UPI0026174C83|nr:hypothetical protein [Desulfobacula sp.]